MNPTPKQLKDWRAREGLTLKQAAEVCGIKNFSRHVSGPKPQRLPAPNWFRCCTYSALGAHRWRDLDTLSQLSDRPEIAGESKGIRFMVVALNHFEGFDIIKIIMEMER